MNGRVWWIGCLVLALTGLAGQACSLEVAMAPAEASALDSVHATAAPTQPAGTTDVAPVLTESASQDPAASGSQPPAPTSTGAPRPTPRPSPTPSPTSPVPATMPPQRIVAPSIGLDAPVIPVGWQEVRQKAGAAATMWVVPDDAAGWHANSAMPGNGGNIVLSGHHNMGSEVFRYLVDLTPGDRVTLYADGREYTYVVSDRFVLPERGVPEEQRRQNAQWITPTAVERLTLVTCWPYTDNSHRVIVLANPAAGSRQQTTGSK